MHRREYGSTVSAQSSGQSSACSGQLDVASVASASQSRSKTVKSTSCLRDDEAHVARQTYSPIGRLAFMVAISSTASVRKLESATVRNVHEAPL